jgi:hypothetical protein
MMETLGLSAIPAGIPTWIARFPTGLCTKMVALAVLGGLDKCAVRTAVVSASMLEGGEYLAVSAVENERLPGPTRDQVTSPDPLEITALKSIADPPA